MEPQNQQQPQVFTPGQPPQAQIQEPEQPAPLQYNSGQLVQQQAPDYSQGVTQPSEDGAVNWSASEFIAHEKNGSWFAMLIAGSIILGVIVYIVTREALSLIAIAVLAVAVGVYGNLKPRVLDYKIAPNGITIGPKHFDFAAFKSFSIIDDSALPSIVLLPQKRFMATITLYLDPVQTDEIIDALGEYLPFEHRERDLTDKLSSRFRF